MTVKYDDREAVAHGKITTKPLRERPGAPSWALKLIMAITGIIFGLFVFVHMIGNLKIFLPDTDGVNHLNEYAAFLREFGEPMLPYGSFLWAFRIVLLVCLVAHVYSAFALQGRAHKSRGKFRRSGLMGGLNSFSARTMLITGIVLLAFIIFHLLDLTIGAGVAPSSFEHGEAYQNVIASFSRPGVVVWYIIAQLALLLHLSHGLWTATSDLGITGKRWRKVLLFLSGLLPLLVVVGNIFIPVAVLTGLVS